ncbi:uncharacterized protein C16orf78 homolog [Echinops telfairi]|uniref:Uncharacterized protein C16orf78 homolog n=1 Tax=Echinops telfairi TaxID=9371 RepID=A0AC55DCN5_ECHTE|nr:uncharacterized protein C16orf78 homolog [Echinops telfairi]
MLVKGEDPKDVMATERKSTWRTAEERRMSDLTRVLEWMERRHGKKKLALQKSKPKAEFVSPKATGTTKRKSKGILKKPGRNLQLSPKVSQKSPRKEDAVMYRRLYGMEQKGKRLSMVPGSYVKASPKKSDIEVKDSMTMESSRGGTNRRQSSLDPIFQESMFPSRKSTIMREWITKTPDTSYERKLKTLMEKGTEPKIEAVKMLKPEEVLSCRYLRLSKNNIKTLLKLCKDAGMNVDIHPHMIEGDINAKMVFDQSLTTAL